MVFDKTSTTLTCTSTGGPPTTVKWKKDGVSVNTSHYQQSKKLVDAESATYRNTLFGDNACDFVGTFTCEVSNSRGSVQETVQLNGKMIVNVTYVYTES